MGAGILGGGLIGKIAGGVAGTAQGIFGLVQATKAKNQMNKLLANRPKYDISKGYLDAYKTYQKLAGSEMPGYGQMQDQIGQATAKATTTAEQGAMSSSQFMNAALGSQEKELDAIKNLGMMSAQWRGQQQQNMAQAQNQMGGLQDTQWQQNVNEPWNMRMNMASENRQAGMQNLFQGFQSVAGSAQNYVGTQSYLDAIKASQPQSGTSSPALNNGNAWANWNKPNFVTPKPNLNLNG